MDQKELTNIINGLEIFQKDTEANDSIGKPLAYYYALRLLDFYPLLRLQRNFDKNFLKEKISECLHGNFELVTKFINNANINRRTLALLWCAVMNHTDIAKYLLTNKLIDVHVSNDKALFYAAAYGNEMMVRLLVESGANIYANDHSTIIMAACKGHSSIIIYLYDQSVKKGTAFPPNTLSKCLSLSADHGDIALANFLLENGANVNYENGRALYGSINCKKIDMVKFLVGRGADPNIRREMMMFSAVSSECMPIVDYLCPFTKKEFLEELLVGFGEDLNSIFFHRGPACKVYVDYISNFVKN